MPLNYSFAGKKVLVTGGGQGIGYEIVKAFYDDGAILFVIDKEQSLLDKLKVEMPGVTTICQDLLDWNGTRKAVEDLGPLDHLINNAGVAMTSFILDASERDFDVTFGVNVKGLANCSIAFGNTVKKLVSEGDKHERTIVNISSIADRMVLPGAAFYCGTKAAVTMLTKCMAVEFSSLNIRVNCVNPGFIDTELVRKIKPEIATGFGRIISRLLIEEPIQPKDVANAVLYLSSPLCSKTTGESHTVDSGLSIN